ncbi:MAG: GMC family oxidoreductase [Rhodothermia bacterium]|nr:GMC family oxidoreductase [Rhodothermia bacterium]
MIIDAQAIEPGRTLQADVCIIGAGPAGLTLATELDRHPIRVVILERGGKAGGQKPIESVGNQGIPYRLGESRRYGIGGTAWAWDANLGSVRNGAQLLPYDYYDFQCRHWIPHSGWPFGIEHLTDFYERAYRICGLSPDELRAYDRLNAGPDSDIGLDADQITPSVSSYVCGDVFTRDLAHKVRKSPSIDIIFNAMAVDLESIGGGRHVTRVNVLSVDGHRRFSVEAKSFVLAAGGIENPRILLDSTSDVPKGLGNDRDLVGRFFMEHPRGEAGILIPRSKIMDRLRAYAVHTVDGYPIRVHLNVNGDLLSREHLQACRFALWPTSPDWLDDDLRDLAVRCHNLHESGGRPMYALSFMLEQAPDRSNRIMLAKQSGNRTAVPTLDWRLGPSDYRSLIRCGQLLQEAFERAGAGSLYLRPHSDETGGYESLKWRGDSFPIRGSHHHIGTTRMHESADQGVVDSSCQVHGTDNLFVAGSSVFPTSSHANPTLTIVALSLRLADELKDQLPG